MNVFLQYQIFIYIIKKNLSESNPYKTFLVWIYEYSTDFPTFLGPSGFSEFLHITEF